MVLLATSGVAGVAQVRYLQATAATTRGGQAGGLRGFCTQNR